MTQLPQLLGILAASLACGLFSSGCSSVSGPASASFASVTIKGHTSEQIRTTTVAVFREKGYQALSSGETMVFDREGSRAETISRDGLVAAQGGARTIVRMRVEIVALDAGSHRLQGQTYMVSGAGDSFFEEEHRLTNIRSRPYQNILDEVAKRLKQP